VTANDTQAAVNDKLAELVNKYSAGRISASARHGGSLGNAVQMLAATQAGAVHATVTPSFVMSPAVPEVSLFDLSFLLGSPSPARITEFAAQSKAAARMIELAKQKGLHILGLHGIGPQGFLSKFPINKVSDFQGRKFGVNYSPPRASAVQDWGGVVRMMGLGEWYTALQQGLIEGIDLPPDVLYRMKFHEAAKYYTVTDHVVLVSAVILSKKWFDALPKDLQDAVNRAGKETIAFADEGYTKAQAASLEALRKAITVTTPPPAELQKMKDLVRKGTWEKMRNDPKQGPMLKLLEEDVARFTKS
jgi:TRAP-type C4-dicarboxylate transport system substrate-binding protein